VTRWHGEMLKLKHTHNFVRRKRFCLRASKTTTHTYKKLMVPCMWVCVKEKCDFCTKICTQNSTVNDCVHTRGCMCTFQSFICKEVIKNRWKAAYKIKCNLSRKTCERYFIKTKEKSKFHNNLHNCALVKNRFLPAKRNVCDFKIMFSKVEHSANTHTEKDAYFTLAQTTITW
jgi:hypothetical protein